MEHLEASREQYGKGRPPRATSSGPSRTRASSLQCMQMRANQVTRDASMAANVKWILDHSPGAKIVLWAHNGHVMTAGNWVDGFGVARDVWQPDGGLRVLLQPGLIPGSLAGRQRPEGFHCAARAGRQPGCHLGGDRHSAVRSGSAGGTEDRPVAEWLHARARYAQHRRHVSGGLSLTRPWRTMWRRRHSTPCSSWRKEHCDKNVCRPRAAGATFDFKEVAYRQAPRNTADPEEVVCVKVLRAGKSVRHSAEAINETRRGCSLRGASTRVAVLPDASDSTRREEEEYTCSRQPRVKAALRVAAGLGLQDPARQCAAPRRRWTAAMSCGAALP